MEKIVLPANHLSLPWEGFPTYNRGWQPTPTSSEQLCMSCPFSLSGFCKVRTVYSVCHLGLHNQTTFSYVDLNFTRNANCFVKLKWIFKQWSSSISFWWFIAWWKKKTILFFRQCIFSFFPRTELLKLSMGWMMISVASFKHCLMTTDGCILGNTCWNQKVLLMSKCFCSVNMQRSPNTLPSTENPGIRTTRKLQAELCLLLPIDLDSSS